MYKITIEQGNEHKDFIQENIFDPNDIFCDVYAHAMKRLIAITKLNDNNDKTLTNDELHGYSNNFIAFVSGRGNGKTTAMNSFAKALDVNNECKEQIKELGEFHFQVLDSIDPTIMSDQDSLLLTVLSRMFGLFKKEYEKRRMKYQSNNVDLAKDV